jgi:hypothetical protein
VPMMDFADCPVHNPCGRSDGGIRRFDEYCRETSPRLSEWELRLIDNHPTMPLRNPAVKEKSWMAFRPPIHVSRRGRHFHCCRVACRGAAS